MNKTDTAHHALRQIQLAAVLLTRLPLPVLPRAAFENAARAAWAYPVIGAGLGVFAVFVGWAGMALGLGEALASGMMLVTLIVTTGAMHEDGLADCADGFWGGTTPVRRLAIMRDSQIGTYGTLALVMLTSMRWSALVILIWANIWGVVAAAALSRGLMPWVMARLPHARSDGLSRQVGRVTPQIAGWAALIGFVIAVLCVGGKAVPAFLCAVIGAAGVMAVAKRKLGGQTGDVLGATQQITETIVLLTLVATLT